MANPCACSPSIAIPPAQTKGAESGIAKDRREAAVQNFFRLCVLIARWAFSRPVLQCSAPRARRSGAAQAFIPAAESRSEVDALNAQSDHFRAALVVECSAEEMAGRAARSASVPCHSSGAAVAAPGTVPANDEL